MKDLIEGFLRYQREAFPQPLWAFQATGHQPEPRAGQACLV